MAGDHSNDDVNNMGNTKNHSQQEEYNTIKSVSMEHTEPIMTLSQPTSNPGNYDGLNRDKNMEDMIRMVHEINSNGVETNGSCQGMFNVPSDLNTSGMRTHVDVVWSELTSDKRKEVMDTICAMWDAFVAENPNVTSAHSSNSVKTGSLKSMDNGNKNLDDIVHVDDPIVQSVSIQDKPSSYVATTEGSLPEPSVDLSIPSKFVETNVLKESLTMGVPLIEDMGFTIETVTIEYEWKPPRCDLCKIFGHVPDHCPKKVSITPIVDTPIVEKTNDGFQTVRKKKKNGKSKSNNGVQFGGQSVKQIVRYEPKATANVPNKGATNRGNASKSSSMLKNQPRVIIPPTKECNIAMSNSYAVLDDESEEDVENVYNESVNLLNSTKTGENSSTFMVAAG
ncbi:hypothetical protein Tco_1025227 [Tanacetum coccineum]